MKYFRRIIMILIINFLIFFISGQTALDFSDSLQFKDLVNNNEFNFIANYKRSSEYKYLYMFPKNLENQMNSNKAVLKIYFKQVSDKDSGSYSSLNYLNSDFSSIDFNAGLFIKLSDLSYDKGIVYVHSYQTINLRLYYKYTKDISFPSYYKYSNFQLNQFILKKGETQSISYNIPQEYDDFLLILSKTSLRNIEIMVKYKNEDVSKEKLNYLYPNGCSIALKDNLDVQYINFVITIKNKNTKKDEIILLGYEHHREDEIFPNELVNGFQIYLEGNQNRIEELLFSGNSNSAQYFTYQIYSKGLDIDFLSTSRIIKHTESIKEYNSMFFYKIDYEGKIVFHFFLTPKRNALYLQCLDYSDIEVAQKSLQPLITGVPKSMMIPAEKSMYHFLPKERDSENLYFYLRPKTQENIYISFEKCNSYPENCFFSKKRENDIEIIKNIGFWYTLPRNNSELQLINVYCEKECAYDILMKYEEDEPLFLFPDTDYSQFISEEGKDTFVLPVFEYFEKSETKSLYIDLTVFSGKADLTLKNGREGSILKYDSIKVGNKKSFVINSDTFLKDTNYYKKEIYAVVEQDNNYKNTFYNIMYGSGDTNAKLLHNNIVYNELLTVPEDSKESDYTKTFNIMNNQKKDLYISISSQLCKIKVTIDKESMQASNDHFYILGTGIHQVDIYLVNDGELCISKAEEKVTIFTYKSDSNVLLSENTLINTTFLKTVSFIHLFKPNEDEDSDNSFNIEIERLNEKSLGLTYELKRISFNGYTETSDISSSKINSKKIRYISNKQINKICGSLEQNELCSLKMAFVFNEGSKFSLQLTKNGVNRSKKLTDQTLISSVNTNSVQYFYIDVDKSYDLELLINSYGQDIKINYEVKTSEQEDESVLPLTSSYTDGLNCHQIQILKSQFSKCSSFCRLYIGVCASKDISGTEVSSLFSIGYHYLNSGRSVSDIILPLNYFAQYTLSELTQVSFVIDPFEKDKFIFELYVIKQNEDDDSEVTATISGAVTYTLKSSVGKYIALGESKQISVIVKNSNENNKPTFKFRVSSIGKSLEIIPMISSYAEKCVSTPCYYLLDDFTSDNEETSAFFYIPESEKAVVNYLELKSSADTTKEGTYSKNTNAMRNSNWLDYPINDKQHYLIIKVEDKGTLYPSFYNKPNLVTLNYGEKRMFSIRKYSLDNIVFNIKKPSTSKNKYRINIHSISGNGLFKFENEIYALGLENSYKEDISIIIDNDKLINIELIASNEKNGQGDDNDDFVFTIEYTIEIMDRLLYEINYNKINSFKFYRNEKISDIYFYMDISDNASKDLNMNIKIYSNSSTYTVNSYLLKKDFINNKFDDYKTAAGKVKTYIQGGSLSSGEFTFAKLEIPSSTLEEKVKEYPYVCVVFTQKDKNSNAVKIDLYPYDMINNNPLPRNELFVQKIPANTEDYQLLLAKSEFYYKQDVKINFISPLSNKYSIAISHSTSSNEKVRKDESNLLKSNAYDFGQDVITLNSGNVEKKNIAFNIFASDDKEDQEDYFIFSYKNQLSADEEIYYRNTKSFKVYGTSRNITYEVYALSPKNITTGSNILIMSAYKKSEVEKLGIDEKYMALYLLFNDDITPTFRKNKVLDLDPTQGIVKTHTTNDIKGGEFYFTAVSIIEDKGREQYLAYEGIYMEIEDSDPIGGILDYMKNHVFATILIIIVIMLVLGIMVNICRAERRHLVVVKGGGDKELNPIN